MKEIFFLSLLLLGLSPPKSTPQNFGIEKLLTINDGLSQNSALAIIQDRKGFIWIGTKDGLNRFDGIGFKVYRHLLDKNSLVNNHIKCLYEDSNGNIWIGTYGGLNKFNPITEQFTAYKETADDSSGLCSNVIKVILEDCDKNIWIGTKYGLNKLITANNRIIGKYNGSKGFKVLDGEEILCLYEDREKNIWVGTLSSGLFCLSRDGKTFTKFPIDTLQQKGSKLNFITAIVETTNGKMLVGTSGEGLFVFDKKTEKFSRYDQLKKEHDYSSRYIMQIKCIAGECYVLTNRLLYKITESGNLILWQNHILPAPTRFFLDWSGIIWIGSDGGGIVKLEPFKKKFNTVRKENFSRNGFSFSSIRTILKVKNDLLIGGYTGLLKAKNYRSGKQAVWNKIKLFNGLNVYTMAVDPINENILWVGTEGSGLFKYNLKNNAYEKYTTNIDAGKYYFLSNAVYDILIRGNNDIYFATGSGTVKYSSKKKSFTNFIYDPVDANTVNSGDIMALCEDQYGNIWMGSNQSGISIYNPKKNSFIRFESHHDKNDSCSLSNNKVNIIFEDSKKNIWVGTAGGLNKYSSKKNNFTVYRTNNGLPNDCIYGILEDKNGFLWLSTNKGLSKFNPEDATFVNYDYSHGLQSNEFNTAAYYKDSKGEMFFGGIKGFTSFYPDEIIQNSYAPSVIIMNFKKFNQSAKLDKLISYVDKIVLPYNDYFFSFDFVMPEYVNPFRHMFAYKLSGLDERWITLTNGERTAAFTAVPPGEYTLVVKGANSDGIWSSKETQLKIVIEPALWNTWWFRCLAVSFLCVIAGSLYKSRVNRLKHEKEIQADLTNKLINSQEDERKNISTELHDDLGQNLLVVKNRLMMAERDKNFAENLNDVMKILDNSIQDVSDISHLLHPSELEELGLSLAIESMIYRIKCASNLKIINNLFSLDEYFAAEEKINVFRIIQEALNNVLKHAHATEVILSSDVKKRNLSISITDNGMGFTNSQNPENNIRPHIGLQGMKERALLLKGVLTVNSLPNKGATIKIEFLNRIKT